MLPFLLLLTAYLAGAVPVGVLVARAWGLPDPRTQGSGNVGATNMLRVGGRRAALATFAGDSVKGAAPVLLAVSQPVAPAVVAGVALAAVVGHCFPVTLGGRGGKGVATGFGAFLALAPPSALLALGAFVLAVAATRTASVGAMVAGPALLAGLALTDAPGSYLACGAVVVALIVVRHHDNLRRLLVGREKRVVL